MVRRGSHIVTGDIGELLQFLVFAFHSAVRCLTFRPRELLASRFSFSSLSNSSAIESVQGLACANTPIPAAAIVAAAWSCVESSRSSSELQRRAQPGFRSGLRLEWSCGDRSSAFQRLRLPYSARMAISPGICFGRISSRPIRPGLLSHFIRASNRCSASSLT